MDQDVRRVMMILALFLTACGGGGGGGSSSGGASAEAERPEAFEDLRMHQDLVATAHLADVDYQGLFIDFGTPARMKYTSGGWKTGWGSDGIEGQTTFTHVGQTGRVYFPVASAGPTVLRFRAKPVGSQNMMLFLNGRQLPSVRFEAGAQFRDYDVAVPAEAVHAGENHLLLRFGGSQRVGNEDVSVAIDSLRVVPGNAIAAGDYAAPVWRGLVGDVNAGGTKRRAVSVRPGTTLSYYVDVPQRARLTLGIGAEGTPSGLRAKVSVTPEGGSAAQVFDRAIEGEWHDEAIELDRYAGQVVRVDLRAEGSGSAKIGWSALGLMTPEAEEDDDERPAPAKNVIVLVIDTMRADKLRPFNPRSRVQAPIVDRLAAEGTVFTLAHSPENWTKPSVASILTGTWPATHGAKSSESRLPDAAVTVGEIFQRANFETSAFLANGYVSDRFGFDQGWDHYTNYIRENKPSIAENVFREAGDWIERNKNRRFFTYIQTIDPHVPYDPPAQYLQMYDAEPYAGPVQPRLTSDQLERAKRRPPAMTFTPRDRQRLEALYDGEVSYHDAQLGRFIERLTALGVWNDTVLVITSDHGEEFYEHQSYGHGHSLYEELLRVPLLIRGPGVPAGRITTAVSTAEIAPTIVELAGIAPQPTFETQSLVSTMRGTDRPGPDVAFSDFLDDRRTVTAGRWKLILRGINAEFFDLQEDPSEQREMDMLRHPIASRYCRIMIGQFLGATNRARWLEAEQGTPANRFTSETTNIDPATRAQLQALGYAN